MNQKHLSKQPSRQADEKKWTRRQTATIQEALEKRIEDAIELIHMNHIK